MALKEGQVAAVKGNDTNHYITAKRTAEKYNQPSEFIQNSKGTVAINIKDQMNRWV